MNYKILVVDDDRDIAELIEQYLKNNGYSVFKACDGIEALSLLSTENVDLIILDVMMPELNGIQTCLKIRQSQNVPIIFLTAKGEDSDIVHGLSAGGDDYIVKPFSSVVLLAKVATLLRRHNTYNNQPPQENLIIIDELIIDKAKWDVIINGVKIKLTPKEFEILLLLASNKGRVFSISQIHDQVWGEKDVITENSVMVHIANLRSKIEIQPKNPQYIKTVWGFGYKI